MKTIVRPVSSMPIDEFFEIVDCYKNRGRRFELDRGRLLELPRPTRLHKRVCVNIYTPLKAYSVERAKGYVVKKNTDVILQRDPDIVRRSDVAYFGSPHDFDDAHMAPRLAVDVLSAGDTASYLQSKVGDYFDHGVEIIWVVNPTGRRIVVLSRTGLKFLTEDDTITGERMFPGFRCKVADFFVLPASAKKPKRKRDK